MAATVFSSSGPAFYTDVTLQNNYNDNLILSDQKDWYGSGNLPPIVQAKRPTKFRQDAGPQTGSSKGGAVYATAGGIKWVIAWSNMNGESNKAYVGITMDTVVWADVDSLLDTSSSDPAAVTKFRYKATATIDKDCVTFDCNIPESLEYRFSACTSNFKITKVV